MVETHDGFLFVVIEHDRRMVNWLAMLVRLCSVTCQPHEGLPQGLSRAACTIVGLLAAKLCFTGAANLWFHAQLFVHLSIKWP